MNIWEDMDSAGLIDFTDTDMTCDWVDFASAFDESVESSSPTSSLTTTALKSTTSDAVDFDSAYTHSPNMFSAVEVRKSNKLRPTKSTSRSIKKCTTANLVASKIPMLTSDEVVYKLYAFPEFDKSDALLYLPSTYARLLNSGDMEQLSRLMRNYCQKDCKVLLSSDITIDVGFYLDLLKQADIIQADSMMCMHSTKVVGNQIHAVLYHKHTDTAEMHQYMSAVVTRPEFKFYFVGDRVDILRRNLRLNMLPKVQRDEILAVLALKEELQIYGKLNLIITFDPCTKKFVDLYHKFCYTSVTHNGIEYALDSSSYC